MTNTTNTEPSFLCTMCASDVSEVITMEDGETRCRACYNKATGHRLYRTHTACMHDASPQGRAWCRANGGPGRSGAIARPDEVHVTTTGTQVIIQGDSATNPDYILVRKVGGTKAYPMERANILGTLA